MSSKIRVLIWISVIFIVVEMGVTLLFFEVGSPWFKASADFDDHAGNVFTGLIFQGVSSLLLYWGTVALYIFIERKRIVQVTLNPKFGRE